MELFSDKNIALVIGHPGHELRVFHFINLYKPRVYVLTDGSGSVNTSRLSSTLKILEQCGAVASPFTGCFTDKELYNIILQKNYKALTDLIENIALDFEKYKIDVVAGDAIEGFNPAHDLCRYIINCVVLLLNKGKNISLENFDFLLDGMLSEGHSSFSLMLTDKDVKLKLKAALEYKELTAELKETINKYGIEPFKKEHFKRVNDLYKFTGWPDDEVPLYEKQAAQKLKNGTYKQAITFKDHLLPMAKYLTEYAENNQ